ncbi:DUF3038 domain-containing protein [Geitlerinema sp. PCC 9228]|jgi:hypothetical protein|uniref:DUF3038 domain-containing protein n=1 Tax=Geitlerinema sp. PCC 9228 TaxID=111611 RepID=UPI0008F993ED|nr:DUF3038 domain-containing protein [Geitlerinema sp. PCC 9228]
MQPQATSKKSDRCFPGKTVKTAAILDASNSQQLPLPKKKSAQELAWDNMKAQLDLLLLGLESLVQITSEEILEAATKLQLDELLANRVVLWRLRQSSPLRQGKGGRKKLDIEEARSLVLIVCYLAQNHADAIRQAMTLLQQAATEQKLPHQYSILGDYLDAFTNSYQERMQNSDDTGGTDPANHRADSLEQLALKLLVDLFFYSTPNGHRRLWLTLLDRSLEG